MNIAESIRANMPSSLAAAAQKVTEENRAANIHDELIRACKAAGDLDRFFIWFTAGTTDLDRRMMVRQHKRGNTTILDMVFAGMRANGFVIVFSNELHEPDFRISW